MHLNRILLTLTAIIALSGCSLRPVVIDRGDAFIGAFHAYEQKDKICNYSEVEGIGLKVGISGVGLGYFDRKTHTVVVISDVSCSSEIAEVHTGKAAEKELNIESITQ